LGRAIAINGDGETTRDFCYVDNVVQANLLAATVADPAAVGQVYNVAVGGRLSLNELAGTLRDLLRERHPALVVPPPRYQDFREGDVRHSQADIGKATRLLGYAPTHDVRQGLAEAMGWYEARAERDRALPLRAAGD
jgi:UDP-N-acetylglucosamine 4-epimerase